MFIVIACMVVGIAIGIFLRSYKIRSIHRIILTLIWLLLFLLGLEVGANESVVQQFGQLGFEAFLLAFGGTLGSVIFAGMLYKSHQHPHGSDSKSKLLMGDRAKKFIFTGIKRFI